MKFFYRSLLAIVLVVMATDSCYGDYLDDYHNLIAAASLKQVSKGEAGVWGVSKNGSLLAVSSYSHNWIVAYGENRIREVCVCDKVYVVFDGYNNDGPKDVYFVKGITNNTPHGTGMDPTKDGKWEHFACSSSSLWAINDQEEVFYKLIGVGSEKWNQVSGSLVRISVGKMGVWGINKQGRIYYRKDTYGGEQTGGSKWIQTDGLAISITSGEEVVVILSSNGYYYVRKDISASKPEGTDWVKLDKPVKDFDRYPARDSLL